MAIRRGAYSALLARDLRKVYVETYQERPIEHTAWINVENMPWNPMSDLNISGLSTMPEKLEGEQFDLDEPIIGSSKQYEALSYGLAVEITFEMIQDELYGVMRELSAELARSSRHRQEIAAHSVLNRAFSTSYTGFTASTALCGAHVGLDGETRRNRPVTDVEFGVTYIQEAIERFEGQTNERNLPDVMTPVMAVIGPSNKWIAREVLGSSGKPYTTDNEINALIQEDLNWMISHYLTTSTYAFLLAAKGVHDLNFFWRQKPMFNSFDDPWTGNSVHSVFQRHTESGFGAWRGVDGTTGA